MTKFQSFKKDHTFIVDENGKKTEVPVFVTKCFKNYRFDSERKILQKICIDCKKYFDVQELVNGEFVDIHNENEIHFHSYASGYRSRCNVHHIQYIKEKNQIPTNDSDILAIENTRINTAFGSNISEVNVEYIKAVAAYKNISNDICLDETIDKIRKMNPIIPVRYYENI